MDEEALKQQYERYGYMVYRRCLALLGNRADAQDAMQDVFIRAQRYGRRHDASPLAWLYLIATRCCYDLAHKRRRAAPSSHEQLEQVECRVVGSHDDGDTRALVGRALRELDEDVCEMGLLHHLGGLTQEEVAVQTGYSRRTVGKKLATFNEALRRWAGEEP